MTKKMTICALMLLCCFVTDADIVKSSVSMRENAMKNEQTSPNPYVTKGLVAMWDGKWNAGIGVHDPNATTWKDLYGGLSLPISQHMQWSANSLQMRPTSGSDNQSGFNDIPADKIFSAIINSPWSIEVGYSFPSARTNNMLFQLRNYGYIMNTGGNIILRFTSYVNTRVSSSGGCYSIVFDGISSLSLFHDSQAMWSGKGSPNQLSSGTIRANNSGNQSVDIDYYFIRIYSRALTADDVAANYAIDKERFGL